MSAGAPLRIIVVGAGNMGRRWLGVAQESPELEVVGLVDIELAGARAAAEAVGRGDLPVATSVDSLLERVEAEAIANVTIPEAHRAITEPALLGGLPVISEKPAAATLAESLLLAAASEVSGQLFVVSQSRRHNRQLHELRRRATALGRIGIASTEFFRAPRFGGFRDDMAHPLLLDMAIHPFDSARFLLGADPVAVYCEEHNPSWSWYRGDAAATAIFEMDGGIRYVYTGSWASPGAETSWNGAWRVSGEGGSALWDGDTRPQSDPPSDTDAIELEHGGISASLHAFARSVRTGEECSGEIHDNLLSLAMVEAAVVSARTTSRVRIDDVLEDARREALQIVSDLRVRDVLESWGHVGAHLRSWASTRDTAAEQVGA